MAEPDAIEDRTSTCVVEPIGFARSDTWSGTFPTIDSVPNSSLNNRTTPRGPT